MAQQQVKDAPPQQLSPDERRARSIENLSRLAFALQRYIKAHGQFPQTIYDSANSPCLSWRVRLLPMLGYEALLDEFRPDQPWDSPHNLKLLMKIPPPFQSPERFDGRTNYLALAGADAAMSAARASKSRAEDLFANKILLAEVDDAFAVPWTKPEDFAFQPTAPRKGLSELRENGFLAVFGKGEVRLVPARLDEQSLVSLVHLSAAPINALAVTQAPNAAPSPAPSPALEGSVPTASTASVVRGRESAEAPNFVSASKASLAPTKAPPPDEGARTKAMKDVRELFLNRYQEARRPKERCKIATEILRHSDAVGEDSAARFVLLRAALDIAASHGDLDLAQSATEKLESHFEIDLLSIKRDALKSLAQSLDDDATRRGLAKWAQDTGNEAYTRDDYAAAREFHQMALNLARSAGDRQLQRELLARQSEIENTAREYNQLVRMLKAIEESPDDPDANLAIGKFMCFVKDDWDQGLAFLAKGSNRQLADLALRDQSLPTDPELQAGLGDGWYSVAEDYGQREAQTIQARAAYWYRQALSSLPQGLTRLKAEVRLKELDEQNARTEKGTALLRTSGS